MLSLRENMPLWLSEAPGLGLLGLDLEPMVGTGGGVAASLQKVLSGLS